MNRTGHKTFAAYSRYVDVNKESMDQANSKWDEMFESKNQSSKKETLKELAPEKINHY